MSDRSLSEEELRNEVIQRSNRAESDRRIAKQLGVSRWKVAKIIRQNRKSRGLKESNSASSPPPTEPPPTNPPPTEPQSPNHTDTIPASLGQPIQKRASKLDAFEPQLQQLLQRYPRITVIRLQEELQGVGYTGGYSILAQRVRELRARPAKPLTVRFETGPGAQAQMDWATYEIDFTQEGRRKVQLFSYILGYSRRQYIHFTVRQDFETTIRQHIEAFKHLGGVAATCLYDNMKVVVTRWEDDHPIYNTRFLAFATHYGYRPWACQIRRPQTKGKVERPFYYIETNLLGGRQFRSIDHLNESARWWLAEVADKRIYGTTKKTPLELHAQECSHTCRSMRTSARHFVEPRLTSHRRNNRQTRVRLPQTYSVPSLQERLLGDRCRVSSLDRRYCYLLFATLWVLPPRILGTQRLSVHSTFPTRRITKPCMCVLEMN